jgi:ABC-type antimicrobial peptide transport system permease subunit
VLSTLGVVMGAASLVAVLSIGDGAERFARQQIERRGLQTVMIRAQTSDTVDNLQVPRADFPLFTPDDLRDLAAFVPRETEALLIVEGTGTLTVAGKSRAALVQGLAAGNPRRMGLSIWAGRAFTAISLIVGGIGIMNVLLASVAERTKEIGVRKAAGARRRDIIVQFLAESVVISMAGAIVGAILRIAGAYLVTYIMRSQTMAQVYAAVTWQTLAVAMGAATLVGLIFGTYPALKAANLSPVDAMRYE